MLQAAVLSESGLLALLDGDDASSAGRVTLTATTRADHCDGLAWRDEYIYCSGKVFDSVALKARRDLPSPGNAQLIRPGEDGTLYLARGRELHAYRPGALAPQLLQRHAAPIIGLSVNEERVAACSVDGPVFINEIPMASSRCLDISSKGRVIAVALSRSRRGLLACGDSCGYIYILQPSRSSAVLRTLEALRGRSLHAMVFSPVRSHILYALTKRGTLVELDVDRKVVVSKTRLNMTTTCIAIANEGRSLAIGTTTGVVLLLDTFDITKPAIEVICDQGNAISQLAFKPTAFPVSPSLGAIDRFRPALAPSRTVSAHNVSVIASGLSPSPLGAIRMQRAVSLTAVRAARTTEIPRRATTPDIVVRGPSPTTYSISAPPLSPPLSPRSEKGAMDYTQQSRDTVLPHRRVAEARATSPLPSIAMQRISSSDSDDQGVIPKRATPSPSPMPRLKRSSASALEEFLPLDGTPTKTIPSSSRTSRLVTATVTDSGVSSSGEDDVMSELRSLKIELLKQSWLTRSELRATIEESVGVELRQLRAENAALKAEIRMLRSGK